MARSCRVNPRVKNSQGNLEESILFQDLLTYFSNNRKKAINVYATVKSNDFNQEWLPKLNLDKNGEPTINSLLKHTNLSDYIPEEQVLRTLNKEIGYYEKKSETPHLIENTQTNRNNLIQKAISFNNNSTFNEDYVANIYYQNDNNKSLIGIKVERRNADNTAQADAMEYNKTLNDKLRDILAKHGISVGALTEYEERLGINGITDFDQAQEAANGIIELIRLAKGERGEQALPEEVAHFIIAAMAEHPMIKRLLNLISSQNLASEIIGEDYNQYKTLYQNDKEKLAEEAAGQLLAKHFLQGQTIPNNRPYRTLLGRVINAIKNFFRNISATPIQRAMIEADKEFGTLATQLLEGGLDEEIDINNLFKRSGSLYSVEASEKIDRERKRLERKQAVIHNIIDTTEQRLKMYERQAKEKGSKFSIRQRSLIDQMQVQLMMNKEEEAISDFIDFSLEELEQLEKRLKGFNSSNMTLTQKAKLLRDIRNYLNSYGRLLNEIREDILEDEDEGTEIYGDTKTILNRVTLLVDDLFVRYEKNAMPLFIEFIKPFLGKSIEVPFGKAKGTVITVEKLMQQADKDISFFDRWLDSMADSSDIMLKLFDQAVKKAKETARLSTIKAIKRIEAAGIKLEQAGIKGFDWMFERDEKGNLTGKYISAIRETLYNKKKKEMIDSLKEKYGENPSPANARKYNKELQAWLDENTDIINEERVPKMSIYGNSDFEKLNAAQREFYKEIMDIKAELDSYLPDYATTLTNAVKIRKDLLERILQSPNKGKQVWEAIKDEFLRRSDDTEFGSRATITDFEENEIQTLPIYYTRMRSGENMNDMSTDVVSTMIAYASMANDYNQMNSIIDILEIGRELMRERDIVEKKSNTKLEEKLKAAGKIVESTITKRGKSSHIMQRLDDFFEMQVYGRYLADEGTFGKTNIDKGKMANVVNKLTALSTYAVNLLSGISNVATGTVMMRIESLSGQYFSESDTLRADRNYACALPAFMEEVGKRVKTNKLALWNEKFNVMQDYEQSVREINFDKKTWVSRMLNMSTLYLLNTAGEHWMQTRTSLALANRYKMKGPDGKIVSLWDAMEVVYIDPNNKDLGATLEVKKGYTKEDGTEFTDEDLIAFSRRSAAINQRLHGIYNQLDRNALQRLAIGRMAIMYRKWIKPSLNRRWGNTTYNFDLQEWVEGYYITTGRFIRQLVSDLRKGEFDIVAAWKTMSKTEKANVRRTLAEVSQFLLIILAMNILDGFGDKDRPWLARMAAYQARRLYTEVGSLVPGPQVLQEAFTIIKSPAAGVNTIENLLDLTKLLFPSSYRDTIQTGRFKGHTRAYKYVMQNIPMYKTIYRAINPHEAIAFYKQ